MKHLTFVCIGAALLTLALPAVSQETPASTSQSPQKPEAAQCFNLQETTDYDFGDIDPDQSVEHVFVFKNNCGAVVELDNPRASCGCTAAMLSEKIIQPGAEAKIDVKFTPPRGTRGKVSKTVSMYLKGESNPFTILRFSANVISDIETSPNYIQLLESEVGKRVTASASIKNVTEATIDVTDIEASITQYVDTSKNATAGQLVTIPLDDAKLSPAKKMTLKPGETKQLTVTVVPRYKGNLTGSIQFKTPKGVASIQVFGMVQEKPTPAKRKK